MAEVRKKIVKDEYNLEKITQKKGNKIAKKDESKKRQEKEDVIRKSLIDKFRIFCNGIKSEFHKVHWPSKENMIKYSIATIFFIVFCASFFYIIDVVFAFVRSLFN